MLYSWNDWLVQSRITWGKKDREHRSGNKKWTIQRNWPYWVHKTQDKDKQSKNTTQYVLDTTTYKQTKQARHEPSNRQPEVKTNRTSLLCGNVSKDHKTELKT